MTDKHTEERTETHACDLISRQQVLRILTDIGYNHCKTAGESKVVDTIKTMVTVMKGVQLDKHTETHEESTETHACDLIDRQDAIDAIDVLCQEHRYKIPGKRETYSQYNEAWQDALDRAEGAIFNLPSAQPDVTDINVGDIIGRHLPVDQWERIWNTPDGTYKGRCVKCGFIHVFIVGHDAQYNYCPNCGADMRGEQNE